MSDNPRMPDHPSDMPSSRHPEAVSNTPSSVSPGTYSNTPPPDKGGINKTHLRNILIGAITTIIGSTSVYFITQYFGRRTDGNEILVKKEATTRAWKSYVAYENSYTENTLSFEKEFLKTGMDPYLAGVKKESEKFQKTMKDLAKTKNLDKDLVNILNRRLENEKDYIPKHEEHFMIEKKIVKSNKSSEEIIQDMINEEIRWNIYLKGYFERAVNDIKEIAKTLSETYNQPFSMNDFLIVQIFPQQMKTSDSVLNFLRFGPGSTDTSRAVYATNVNPKALIGNWTDGGNKISLKQDKTMSYELTTGYKANGTWAIENDKLRLNEAGGDSTKNKVSFLRLNKITANSFTMTRDRLPFDTYNLVRVKGN
jgi:mRNA-degrading endonuclease YafQ of YafQ-DinJ toxin-antitoxin module